MVNTVMDFITSYDKEVGEAIQAECGRQRRNLELIASENIVSPAVMLAMGTVPTNKYAEGYPGKRYYGGCEDVDILENLAIERAKELFGCEHVCVQPHSGANANTAVYQALLEPGDTVMGLNLAHGGHLTHGSPVNLSGISAMDIAKGLLDNGIHPPTMYFPLIVDEALMVEPTETESKETLDNAIAVFRKLYELAGTDPEKAKSVEIDDIKFYFWGTGRFLQDNNSTGVNQLYYVKVFVKWSDPRIQTISLETYIRTKD